MKAILSIVALLASLAAVGYVKPASTPAKQPVVAAQPAAVPSPRVHRPKAKAHVRSMARPAARPAPRRNERQGMGMDRPAPKRAAAMPSCAEIRRIYAAMSVAQKARAAVSNQYTAAQRAHGRRCLGL